MNSSRIPLSGSTQGEPITIDNATVTVVHASPASQTAVVHVEIVNTTAGALTATLDVNGTTADLSIPANGKASLELAISDGHAFGIQGSAAGLRALGYAEEGHSSVS